MKFGRREGGLKCNNYPSTKDVLIPSPTNSMCHIYDYTVMSTRLQRQLSDCLFLMTQRQVEGRFSTAGFSPHREPGMEDSITFWNNFEGLL